MTILFWTGGTGTWNATTTVHWDTISGGPGNKGLVPAAGDTAVFDGNSGTVTVTVANLSAVCRSLICNGSIGSGAFTGHLVGGNNLEIRGSGTGSILLSPTMTVSLSLTIAGGAMTGVTTLTSAGKSLGSIGINIPGTLLLAGSNTVSGLVSLGQGILNTNNQTCSWGSFSSNGSSTRQYAFGTSQIVLTGTGTVWSVSGSAVTATASSSTITIASVSGAAKTFAGGSQIYGTLTITPGGTGAVNLTGNNSFAVLRCAGNKNIVGSAGSVQTIRTRGGLQLNGSTAGGLVLTSSISGTSWTISSTHVQWISNASLQDVHASGATFRGPATNVSLVSNTTGWALVTGTLQGSLAIGFGLTAQPQVTVTLSGSLAFDFGLEGSVMAEADLMGDLAIEFGLLGQLAPFGAGECIVTVEPAMATCAVTIG